jgi:hypothetical protein
MKKAAVVILLLFSLFSAYAITFDVSLGHRNAVVFDTLVFPQVSVISPSLRGDLRILGKDQIDGLFTYSARGKHFDFETGFHAQTVDFKAISFSPFADVAYNNLFSFVRFRVELGLQLSVLKTKYIKQFMFAIMPVFSVELDFEINPIVIGVYVDDHTINDMAWRNFPVFGAKMAYEINSAWTVYFDAWARATEYLVDNWLMISSTGFRLGVRYTR